MNKFLHKPLLYRILGCLSGLTSGVIILYLWTVLGDRGINADRTNTSGYITLFELAFLILVVPLAVISVVLLLKADKYSVRCQQFTPIFLICLALGIILYCVTTAFLVV